MTRRNFTRTLQATIGIVVIALLLVTFNAFNKPETVQLTAGTQTLSEPTAMTTTDTSLALATSNLTAGGDGDGSDGTGQPYTSKGGTPLLSTASSVSLEQTTAQVITLTMAAGDPAIVTTNGMFVLAPNLAGRVQIGETDIIEYVTYGDQVLIALNVQPADQSSTPAAYNIQPLTEQTFCPGSAAGYPSVTTANGVLVLAPNLAGRVQPNMVYQFVVVNYGDELQIAVQAALVGTPTVQSFCG